MIAVLDENSTYITTTISSYKCVCIVKPIKYFYIVIPGNKRGFKRFKLHVFYFNYTESSWNFIPVPEIGIMWSNVVEETSKRVKHHVFIRK